MGHDSQAVVVHRRPLLRIAGLVAGLLLTCGAVCAGELDLAPPQPPAAVPFDASARPPPSLDRQGYRPTPLDAPQPTRSATFYRSHLLPRLNHQFGKMGAYQVVPDSGRALGEYLLLDDLTQDAHDRSRRATRKAVRDYLLDQTSLGNIVRSARGEAPPKSADRGKPLRLGLKVAHGAPYVDLRYRLRNANLRVGLRPDGSVGVEVRHERRARTRVVAGYDADDRTFDLFCSVDF